MGLDLCFLTPSKQGCMHPRPPYPSGRPPHPHTPQGGDPASFPGVLMRWKAHHYPKQAALLAVPVCGVQLGGNQQA